MAVQKHGVHFDITAENATDRAMRAVENNLQGISKAAAAMGKVMQVAFIATAAISMGKAFASAAMEAEQASKRLDAVLKATGHAAGLTKGELDEMADAMAASTQFDDESLRNASAQMLKFGNIYGATFREGMKLSADLAAFMGTDLTTAVQAVGKALSSPAEGVGTLERQIGKFNPAARQMIEALAENGRTAEAQAIILETLRGKIGGTAEALNTGLTKASHDAKKQWDEMLESIGKTEPFQKATISGLNLVEKSFRDIKSLVESGTWTEKALALLSFGALGMGARAAGWKGPTLTPPPPDAVNTASGRIGGVKPSEPGIRTILTKDELKDFERQAAAREKAAAEAKRLGEKQLREAEENARAHVDLEEMAAQDSREAWDHWGKIQTADEKARIEGKAQMWKDVFETIDREQEEAIAAGQVLLDGMEDDAKKAADAARELGLTFSSAFEDAILGGKKFSEVLKGLSTDIGRIILRKSITEPLGTGISDMFKGSGIGSGIADWVKGLFKAEGGPVMAGEPYIVGERGPELFVPGGAGSVVPNAALATGGGGTTINVYPDLRGASAEALNALHRMVASLNASVEPRALGVMRGARVRGMG